MAQSDTLKALRRAEKAARKNIRVLSDKALNSNLDAFCGDHAEAFHQGVYEAQQEILGRIRDLIVSQQSAEDRASPVGKSVP